MKFLLNTIDSSLKDGSILYMKVINQHADIQPRIISCPSPKQTRYEKTKYIFNLDLWRYLVAKDQLYVKNREKPWCDVPKELQVITNALCQFYGTPSCTRLPCHMIYSSSDTLTNIDCASNGQISTKVSTKRNKKFQCKRGYSLDLFMKDNENQSYPSIIADPFTPITNSFYVKVLHNQYRSCNSMWGMIQTHESLSYYPWSGDREKMKLFDVTFGYDRSVYDFVPPPWLINYIDGIDQTPKRLSLKQVMTNKKPINSPSNRDDYWINQQTNSIQSSYVKASILWMNSNCQTISKRTQYVEQMMKFIDIDNFGLCGTNIRPLPQHIIDLEGSKTRNEQNRNSYNWEAGKLALTSDYLFTIAIENSRSYDYVTEKLWQPLLVGSVPIYLGAPNIEDWLPCRTDCIIDLRKFKTPKDAALFIKNVAKNRTLYESYHQWRNEEIPDKLKKMLKYFSSMRNYSLECVLCEMSKRVDEGQSAKETKKKILDIVGHL
ncbi:unnamed protein product [Adineta ricciae]|uniref:Fucosyltransferase n=1 Tax=Adineta ricciae TaxID=249248 RepID=A0A815KFP9_ADIRI|nr:unnamed protein product [Adineta ricciae]